MASKFCAESSIDNEELFEKEIGYDVIIHAGEEPNFKEIHAHSNILCTKSQYFRAAFSNEWAEKKDGKFIFKKPNIAPQLFNIILRFIYCGNIKLKNLPGPDVWKLLIAVDELNIQPLISYIQKYLIKYRTKFLLKNSASILETVYQHDTFTDLSPLLELLLKRDDLIDLRIDEIEIWKSLLKWCYAQQNTENDPTKWSEEDITKIESSLHKFIPLIRFYDIGPTDFFYEIFCYKDILPQGLIHDLLEFHIVPVMEPKINLTHDSTLIRTFHVPLFASWIDIKDSLRYYKENLLYIFKLLWAESSSDDEKLFEKEIGYDVIIHAGEEPNSKEIHAHSKILCTRSQYFRAAFSNEWAEKKDGKFIFKKPNIAPQLFNMILRFIYCGNIELKILQGPDVLKLLIAVDELNIEPLISHIQKYLIEHQAKFLHQNSADILETVYQHDTFTDLFGFCLKIICGNPKILFESENFINLKAPLLELLLKRDDLLIDEIEIWESLLKWYFAQQNMENDPTKWSEEDITKIKSSFRKFIRLIRFYDIEPTDFFYKIYNYKDILPQDMIHALLEFYIVPHAVFEPNLPPARKSNLNDSKSCYLSSMDKI